MDNQNKIKYKKAGSDWFIKIFLDDKEKEISRTPSFANGKGSGTGLYQEMMAWVEVGNKVEPLYTTEEFAEKEINDLHIVLDSQKIQCIQLLKESDYKILTDSPFSNIDKAAWKTYRSQLRVIIKSNQIEEVPKKPF